MEKRSGEGLLDLREAGGVMGASLEYAFREGAFFSQKENAEVTRPEKE